MDLVYPGRSPVLRDRKRGFSPSQFSYERAARTRAHRKMRVLLQRNMPVFLKAPPWSEGRRFLSEVIGSLRQDLQSCFLAAAPASLSPERLLMDDMLRFCGDFSTQEADCLRSLAGQSLCEALIKIFARTQDRSARVLVLLEMQRVEPSLLQSVVEAFERHRQDAGEARRINLVLCGAGTLALESFTQLDLVDFSPAECLQQLSEQGQYSDLALCTAIAKSTGGVPPLLNFAIREGRSTAGQWRPTGVVSWGPWIRQLQQTLRRVIAEPRHEQRLHQLREGPQPARQEVDVKLVNEGLARMLELPGKGLVTSLRASVMAELLAPVR